MSKPLKRLLPLLILSLCCACARADTPKPLLWKVSDADNSVYLLGSFHLLKPTDYPLAASTDAAFAAAKLVVFEVPPAELDDPTLPVRFLKALSTVGATHDLTWADGTPAKIRLPLGPVPGATTSVEFAKLP